MELRELGRAGRATLIALCMCAGLALASCFAAKAAELAPQSAMTTDQAPHTAQAAVARAVGTIKTISGNAIVLTTDAGTETSVLVPDAAKLVRIEPGAKDLKSAVPLQLSELQPGDRILVRGVIAIDGKTLQAASVIAMKHEDIAAKQSHEREEWQRHGVGGLVTSVDPATGIIKISTNATGVAKDVAVQVTKQTILRRYAPNSVKFDDAKSAPIDQIKVGDQLRARGTRSEDRTQLTADEVVSGTFRNIAGTISAVDTSAGTITVMDLVAKKPLTVKVGPDTQMRKLPPMIAQGIAMRLKGAAAGEGGAASASGTASANPAQKPAETGTAANARGGGQAGGSGGARAGGGDFQQMLSRIPAVTLAELQKGDVVMIVTTEGTSENDATAITLLAGVEPLLEASPKGGASILTPWTMSEAPAGDTTP
ncbi:MAG: hypothetical protein WBG02_10370 [Candidatus Acidiferrum sp.]